VEGRTCQDERLQQNKEMFDLIGKVSGCNVLIDSSKYPTRALLLAGMDGVEVSYIYLRRRLSGVLASFSKQNVEQPSKAKILAIVYYLAMNMFSWLAVLKLRGKHQVISLSYEEMIDNPARVFSHLGATLKMDLATTVHNIQSGRPVEVGLLFEGNRIREMNSIIVGRNRGD